MGFTETLTDARDTLRAAGVAATLDLRELITPGVWLRLMALKGPTLAAPYGLCQVTVYCTVQPGDPERVYTALEELAAAATAVIPPMSDVRHVALVLPAGGAPAAALAYDHHLIITETA